MQGVAMQGAATTARSLAWMRRPASVSNANGTSRRARRYAKSDAAVPSGEHRPSREVEAVVDRRCACMGQGSDQFVDVLLGYAVAILADARVEGRGSQKSVPHFFEHVTGFLERSGPATSRIYRNHAFRYRKETAGLWRAVKSRNA